MIPERIRFSIYVVKKIYGKSEKSEKIRNAIAGLLHDTQEDYEKSLGGYLAVQNSTGGILFRHINTGLENPNPNFRWLLIGEPQGTGKIIEQHVFEKSGKTIEVLELETTMGVEWNSQQFQIDLCRPIEQIIQDKFLGNFDFIICQSLLEHVIDPVQVLLNLSLLLREGGVLSVSTHTPAMPIHKYPIDTLRFNHDFFENVCNYVPFSLHRVERVEHTIIAIYKKSRFIN